MVRPVLKRLMWAGFGLALTGSPAPAQVSSTEGITFAQATRGVAALEAGRPAEAIAFFAAAVATDPTVTVGTPPRSVAFLLGRALEAEGHAAAAREAWWRGVEVSVERGKIDVFSADAFISRTYTNGHTKDYQAACEIYLLLIEQWGTTQRRDEALIVAGHVEQALLLLPPQQRESKRAASQPGAALAAWWRRQDPLPATSLNERLSEHLARVTLARTAFADERAATGLDVRGEIYVRLGEPDRRRVLDFYTPELVRRIQDLREAGGNSLLVSPGSLAAGEVWYYHGREPYHYLFVQEGRRYRIGQVEDLVPAHLRTAVDRSGRGAAKADVLLEVFRSAYEQLAPYDLSYVQRLYDVAGYLGQLEDMATQDSHLFAEQEVAGAIRRADYSAVLQRSGGRLGVRTPDVAAREFLDIARREDELVRRQREERVPASRSTVLDGVEPFGVAARVVRFLERDGTTRAEVYWAPLREAVRLSPELARAAREGGYSGFADLAIRATLVRNATLADRRTEEVHIHTLPAATLASDEPLAPQTITAAGLRTGEDLAVQWDVHLARAREGGPQIGPRARVAVLRTERLEPLRGDGRLEMSDLKPVLGPTQIPVPFDAVRVDQPLALYFEGYGLTYGPDDEVHFAVEYEVRLWREGGGLRSARVETTRGDLFSTVRGRQTEQYLILNPGTWVGAREVEVEVRLRDKTTGEEVRRTIAFRVEE